MSTATEVEGQVALGGTDLNLVLALKVILEEGNVTRAGERLAMSQPAMSGALAKLRRRFDDELLVRSGREYELTPFARELLPEAQEALRLISEALGVAEGFDPATSDREFRITMSDYAIAVVLEPLLAKITAQAPHVRLTVDHLMPATSATDRLLLDYDVMIAPLGYGFGGHSRPLWRDRMVCLMASDHPLAGVGALTLDHLRETPHAEAAFGPGTLTPVSRVLGELDVQRRVDVQVRGWLPLPFVLIDSDMIGIVPERLARMHVRPGGPLVQKETPFGEILLVEGYWYAANRLGDPANHWLFERLDEVAAELAPEEDAS
ncbi:Transcriptional regulator [Nostocoides australiense Ben110]|uniref:Transcriptional regulator n=1 Tax=Nostocoides australiense Ben110 TaxID=1193182 RepID=W6K4F9_9MICO|nr:LysR family transcriptional regulator [Tetrasphaera australiensis]MCA0290850.1 LysR family transcriptional regulator [Actinomycetota bacterium]CCH74944.1 Transcriptional regulator [Tetrasphaera australiensis Ben110]